MWGSRNQLLEFWDPLIYPERLKLKTSNLARKWMAVSTNKKCKIGSKGVTWGSRQGVLTKKFKIGSMGSRRGHVTHFWNSGTP